MQTKLQSFKEVVANNIIGLSVSWFITVSVLQLSNMPPAQAATVISALCLFASMTRSYLIRRFFNKQQNL